MISYFVFKTAKSLDKVLGSHEMYIIFSGVRSNNPCNASGAQPFLEGSRIATSKSKSLEKIKSSVLPTSNDTFANPSLFSLASATAAAESSIGLAILVIYYRIKGTVGIEFVNLLKG